MSATVHSVPGAGRRLPGCWASTQRGAQAPLAADDHLITERRTVFGAAYDQ